jgi:hypothetical protein
LLDLQIDVLDDERLAHLGGKLFCHRTRDDIAKATGPNPTRIFTGRDR